MRVDAPPSPPPAPPPLPLLSGERRSWTEEVGERREPGREGGREGGRQEGTLNGQLCQWVALESTSSSTKEVRRHFTGELKMS